MEAETTESEITIANRGNEDEKSCFYVYFRIKGPIIKHYFSKYKSNKNSGLECNFLHLVLLNSRSTNMVPNDDHVSSLASIRTGRSNIRFNARV